MKYLADADGKTYVMDVDRPNEILVDGVAHHVSLEAVNRGTTYSILIDSQSYEAYVDLRDGVYYVEIGSERHAITVEDERLGRLKRQLAAGVTQGGEVALRAPMPGLVVRVRVEAGQTVEKGQGLVILEAMKMENELRSPRDGVVKSIRCRPGQAVNMGETLLSIE